MEIYFECEYFSSSSIFNLIEALKSKCLKLIVYFGTERIWDHRETSGPQLSFAYRLTVVSSPHYVSVDRLNWTAQGGQGGGPAERKAGGAPRGWWDASPPGQRADTEHPEGNCSWLAKARSHVPEGMGARLVFECCCSQESEIYLEASGP